jgi:hypothetical protein
MYEAGLSSYLIMYGHTEMGNDDTSTLAHIQNGHCRPESMVKNDGNTSLIFTGIHFHRIPGKFPGVVIIMWHNSKGDEL